MAEKLESRIGKTVRDTAKDVRKIRDAVYDIKKELGYLIERGLYCPLYKGLDYENGYAR